MDKINQINGLRLSLGQKRLSERFSQSQIVPKTEFNRLELPLINNECIKKGLFKKSEIEQLANSIYNIIKKGGKKLFMFIKDNIAATCAILIYAGDGYKQAKRAAAYKLEAKIFFLQTDKMLSVANKIYGERGFEKTKSNLFGNNNYPQNTYSTKLILSKP